MKKFLAFFTLFILSLCLVACGGTGDNGDAGNERVDTLARSEVMKLKEQEK